MAQKFLSFVIGLLIGTAIWYLIILPIIRLIADEPKENVGVEVGTVYLWPGEWSILTTDNVCKPNTCFIMRTDEYNFPEYNMHFNDNYWEVQPNEDVPTSLRFTVNRALSATIVDYCTDIRSTPIIFVYRRTEEGEGEFPGFYNIKWRI